MPIRMPSINQIALSGRLTFDPEFRITETGHARLSFSIAINQSYRDRNGAWKEEVTFVPVIIWDKLAEWGMDRLKKGSSVFLSGRLRSRKQETSSGARTVIEVVARNFQLLDKKPEPEIVETERQVSSEKED